MLMADPFMVPEIIFEGFPAIRNPVTKNVMRLLTLQQCQEFQTAFKVFDKDGDETISTNELGSVMRSLGQNPSEIEVQDMINEYDVDGNGKIDFEEFIVLMAKQMKESDCEIELREAFRTFDLDNAGVIRSDELRCAMRFIHDKVTEEEVDEIVRSVDENKDGTITFDEFVHMMTGESLQNLMNKQQRQREMQRKIYAQQEKQVYKDN